MNRKLWVIALTSMVPVVGCSLTTPGPDPEGPLANLGQNLDAAQLEELTAPPRNAMKVMIASRPVDDPVLGEVVWSVADEHVIPAETRRVLEANGLRLGVVERDLPAEVESLLDPEAPPDERIDPVVFALPDGDAVPIQVGPSEPVERLSLFLSRNGGAVGKDYEQARGAIRVTATQVDDGIALRLVPEVHHGPFQRRFAAAENVGAFEPQQFVYKDGQQEESFRDLTAKVTLRPGQVLLIGCWPDRVGSLGHFLLTHQEPDSDRLHRRVVFLWATPSTSTGIPWVEPITPPSHLRPVDPSEVGLETMADD